MATDIESVIIAILSQVKREPDDTVAERHKHQKVFKAHPSFLANYSLLKTQCQAVTSTVQVSMAAEKDAQANQDKRIELLRSIKVG